MTYDEAVAFLSTFANYEDIRPLAAIRTIKLERMHQLCQRLGQPQRRFRSIVVSGTNGKGSICALLYSMLRESSLRVGLYTSPHLEHLRERIRVWTPGGPMPRGQAATEPCPDERVYGDDWIEEEAFAGIMERLQPVLEDMRKEDAHSPPTYFEALTALAFLYFTSRQVDVAVLETGLGGRLDATNVVEQAASVIGPVDLDHVELLGTDPAQIAREKAGIIKPHQTVITGSQREEVMEVLRAVCETHGVPLLVFGQDLTARIQRHDLDGLQASFTGLRGIYESIAIPLLGRHQAQNAALAIGALEALSTSGAPHALVERGLGRIEWPGRLEVVHERPLVLMDGAHNAHAAGALRETLDELCQGRRVHLLVGMSSDKAIEAFGARLSGVAVGATCTKSHHPRALNPSTLARRLTPFFPDVHVMSDPADGYTYLLNASSPEDVVVVTGSLFLVGELRSALRQAHIRPQRGPSHQALSVEPVA